MSNIQTLKRRINTAKNIKQITKAMEMVAASKMRKAQQQALRSRPYSRKLQSTLQTIAALIDPDQHPLLQSHQQGDDIYVLISTDKALAGSLNTNLFRGFTEENHLSDQQKFIIVGQKARQFVLRAGFNLYAEFTDLPDPLTYEATQPLSKMILDGFLSQEFRSVTLIYMDFISTLVQKYRSFTLLPFPENWQDLITNPEEMVGASEQLTKDYLFEPDAKQILDWLLPYYIELVVYQTLLEGKASEHSARMVAMKNASENAGDIIGDLTLSYNKQRQAKITNELLDNTTASMIVSS